MHHLLFHIASIHKKQAHDYLKKLTSHPLYEIKEKNMWRIGGFFNSVPLDLPPYLANFTQLDTEVDWTDQWSCFSPHVTSKLLTLSLKPYGVDQTLTLCPGPGFGDLSHPTTLLCLEAMAPLCKNKEVIDIGSGSGILSIAAWAFGAKAVYSIDIDPLALEHTAKNKALNNCPPSQLYTSVNQVPLHPFSLFVINMTFGDQKMALGAVFSLPKGSVVISSGILETQSSDYIAWGKTKGLHFQKIKALDGWTLFKGDTLQ